MKAFGVILIVALLFWAVFEIVHPPDPDEPEDW